jgi:hypothetical protein
MNFIDGKDKRGDCTEIDTDSQIENIKERENDIEGTRQK